MPTPTARSEATRGLLVCTALRLFREIGYEKTTMRAIAAAPLISRLVILSRLPVVRRIIEDIVQLIRGTRQ